MSWILDEIDFSTAPDIDEYFERDGNLDQYDKDYDEWFYNQTNKDDE